MRGVAKWASGIRRRAAARVERRFIDPQRVLIAQAALSTRRGRSDVYQNLWDLELRVFSQFGEDGILDFLCDQLCLHKPRVLEIGAGDFSECNSRFLAENRQASVFAVDGSMGLSDNVKRPPLSWRTSLWSKEMWVTPDNVSALVEEAREAMGGLDILSLDVDGNDFWILSNAPLCGISLILVEYNPVFGGIRSVSVPRDDHFDRRRAHCSWLYFGASLKAFCDLLTDSGYTFMGTNRAGNNAFFVLDGQRELIETRLQIPLEDQDLSQYTDWRVREARDEAGRMTFSTVTQEYRRLIGLPVINTSTGELEEL